MYQSEQEKKLLNSLDDFEPLKVDGKDKLGKGSFASVSLVRHKESGKLYALKEVPPSLNPRLISLQATTLNGILKT